MTDAAETSTPSVAFLLAGGGTGGHLAPAVAIIEQLRRLAPSTTALVACTDRPIDRAMLDAAGAAYVIQPVRPIPRSPSRWPGFYVTWRRSLALAGQMLRDVRPAAVLGLGGFAAGPAVRKASAMGIPSALLNPDAVAGKANRYLAGRVETIFTQFEASAASFPLAVRNRCRAVGCPIRPSVLGGDRDEAVRLWGLDPAKRTLAVMGGSLGARTINEAMLQLAGRLAERADGWQVLHVTGAGKDAEAAQRYRAAGTAARVLDYCGRMDLLYAAADLLIGRAGANTVAELCATGTPSVLLPYPFHRDRHQLRNAEPLARAGAAEIVPDAVDPAVNAERIAEAIEPMLGEPGRLEAMARAAAELAKPDAAEVVARWLLERARSR